MSADLDIIAKRNEGLALLVGRLAVAALYVPSGFAKLTNLDGFAHSLAAKGLPAAMLLAVAGAGVEFFGGLAVALGFRIRYTALLMIAFTICACLISHRYWELDGAARALNHLQFMKNVAIMGGLAFLWVRGAGPLSLDRT